MAAAGQIVTIWRIRVSQEIIYTSSPEGLRPGSFGFCTVATSPGMATSLAERLEALSGYRHAQAPGHPSNPVVFSHLILKVGGQRLNVLSRIADAGLDYSQRTNKLAHHVALGANELSPAGPAWVLSQPGFAETAWTGKPRILPTGRQSPVGNLSPQVCKAWEKVTGDAGWGGVLAQHALDAKRPAHIIFPEGADVLTLLVEAQSLLPPARRWEVSFSTYFTRLPAGVDCVWRCLLAGSPEATAATALRQETVIDLTRHLGNAPDGPLVQLARTGKLPVVEKTRAFVDPLPVGELLAVEIDDNLPQQMNYRTETDKELKVGPPPHRARGLLSPNLENRRHHARNESRQSSKWLTLLLAGAAAFLMATTIILSVVLIRNRQQLPSEMQAAAYGVDVDSGRQHDTKAVAGDERPEGSNSLDSPTPSDKPIDLPMTKPPKEFDSKEKTQPSEPKEVVDSSVPTASAKQDSAVAGTSQPNQPATPAAEDKPVLPPVPEFKGEHIKPPEKGRSYKLAHLTNSESSKPVQLKLIGGKGPNFELKVVNDGDLAWHVEYEGQFAGRKKIADIRAERNADGLALSFTWAITESSAHSWRLLCSTFCIDGAPERSHYFQLLGPTHLHPLSLQSVVLPIPPEALLSAFNPAEINIEIDLSFPDSQSIWKASGPPHWDDRGIWRQDFRSGFLKSLVLEVKIAKKGKEFVVSSSLADDRARSRRVIDEDRVKLLGDKCVEFEGQEALVDDMKAEISRLMTAKSKKGEDIQKLDQLEKDLPTHQSVLEQLRHADPFIDDKQMRVVLKALKGKLNDNQWLSIRYRILRTVKDDPVHPIVIVSGTEM